MNTEGHRPPGTSVSLGAHRWWFGERGASLACGLLLAAATLAVYWPVGHYEFVDYDDQVYVFENAHVKAGLTWPGMVWAFGRITGEGTYWHPVTWVSLMLDCQLFGVKPGPHHLVNLGFHIANALLLFLVLRRMTQAKWRSAAVAALFALHPLHVESVAWIAERKDVLSTFFFMLTLWAYARYAEGGRQNEECRMENAEDGLEKPAVDCGREDAEGGIQNPESSIQYPAPRITHHATAFYLLSLFFFALGLMSKAMLVTLPFVLLLLDYWPLGRSAECGTRSAESGEEQGKGGNAEWGMQSAESDIRDESMRRSAETPLRGYGSWEGAGKLLLEKLPFFALSGAAAWLTMAGHQRFSAGASAPAIPLAARLANGLVSYSRYMGKTFWPSDLAMLYPFREHWPVALVIGAGALLAGVSAGTLWQLRRRPYLAVGWFWFVGTLVPVIGLVQDGNQAMADRYMYVPLIGLLVMLCWGVAEICCVERGAWSVGGARGETPTGQPESRGETPPPTRRPEAYATWAAGIAVLALLGCAWQTRHQLQYWRNSFALFGRAIAVTQGNYIAEEDFGVTLAKSGARAQARAHIEEALRIKPDHPNGHFNLGLWLAMEGRPAEAAAQYREAIRLRPNYTKALNNLAWMLATHPDPRLRNGAEAVQLAKRAADLTGGNDAEDLDTLGAACAEAHEFARARKVAERAAGLARSAGDQKLAREIEAHLKCYERGQPWREGSAPEPKSPGL